MIVLLWVIPNFINGGWHCSPHPSSSPMGFENSVPDLMGYHHVQLWHFNTFGFHHVSPIFRKPKHRVIAILLGEPPWRSATFFPLFKTIIRWGFCCMLDFRTSTSKTQRWQIVARKKWRVKWVKWVQWENHMIGATMCYSIHFEQLIILWYSSQYYIVYYKL